ncbi:Putative universal stress protein [Rhizobiaceae bacterium]|nr:Putative universal stress protein [Rhizobiaceae bacterium]
MNNPPRTILFATDFSSRCDRSLDRAMLLATQWNARLVLLHVLEKRRAAMPDDARRAEEARLHGLLRAEFGSHAGETETRIARGPVGDTVVAVAGETGADLVVTGVARYDELGDFVLGSTVDRLVRHSPVPVLIVKKRVRTTYDDIVIATDFSVCSGAALRTAAAMFPKAQLHLVHAYHVPFEGLISKDVNRDAFEKERSAEMATFLSGLSLPDEIGARLSTHVVYGETENAVESVVKATGAGLAAIGTHGRSGFVAAMIGSIAEALLATLDCDVLTVRSR